MMISDQSGTTSRGAGGVVKPSLRVATSEAAADSPRSQHRSVSSIRRNTVMLARDVLLRRFSRHDTGSPFRLSIARTAGNKFTIDEFDKLVHEINYMVAAYRQLILALGTVADGAPARLDLSSSRQQCLRTCDTAKNCILPQLKSETHDHHQSSEVTKHASHQFIGCVNMFIWEMRRCQGLLRSLPSGPTKSARPDPGPAEDQQHAASSSLLPTADDEDVLSLNRDLKEAESILETLENAITVHFSIDPPAGGDAPVTAPRTRKKGCQFGKLCSNFKTSYA